MGRGESVPGPHATAAASTPSRRQLGAWYTPEPLVEILVSRTVTADWLAGRSHDGAPVRVLDPSCGDGRLLAAVGALIGGAGHRVELTGVDIDPAAIDLAQRTCPVAARFEVDDALRRRWGEVRFDLVIANPPFRSQMSADTTRGGASPHGGGPYADSAAEFLALSARLTAPGGRLALILPQSVLGSRDAGPIRAEVDRSCSHLWSWWSPDTWFDAQVVVCALGLERRRGEHTDPSGSPGGRGGAASTSWAHLLSGRLDLPDIPPLHTDGSLGDRTALNANFRDEYYGLVPAVSDHGDGPPLVTSGLIDAGHCRWGERPARFAKQRFDAPRVAIDLLDERMRAWARRKLVPKVLVATQTRIVEAVADVHGSWLPGVPVTAITPEPTGFTGDVGEAVLQVAAVLTSPVATLHAWHHGAGTGMSATSIRMSPSLLASVPWPAGVLTAATEALRAGRLLECGRAVTIAYGLGADHSVLDWWQQRSAGQIG